MFILLVLIVGIVAGPPPASAQTGPPAIPGNIAVDPTFRPLLETMLARSPTFRRQCARIEREPGLTVDLRHVPGVLINSARGITHISRSPSGGIAAEVTFNRLGDAVEIIAHEFEHIIERLDNIDLAAKARRARSGVHTTDAGQFMFETTRAVKIGRQAADEMRRKPLEHGRSS